MSFNPQYNASQILGNPNCINFEDVSSGTDSAITSRRVFIQDAYGSFLVEEGNPLQYSDWAIANASIVLDVLSKDKAVRIVVQWLDVDNNILYSASSIAGFTLFNETAMYGVIQALSGNPRNINDNNFFQNLSDMRTDVDSGNQAILFASDIFSAQQCYDRATTLRLNSSYSFNINT